MRSVVLLYSGLLALSLTTGWASRTSVGGPELDLVYCLVFIPLVLAFVLHAGRSVWGALDVRPVGWRGWWLAAGVSLACGLFVTAYFNILESLGAVTLELGPDIVHAGWPLWSAYLMLAVHPAIFEELAFRGFIQHALSTPLGPRQALFVQAGLFSMLHLSPLVFVSHFVMGWALGEVRSRTGSLVPGMLMHGAWNAHVLYLTMRAHGLQ